MSIIHSDYEKIIRIENIFRAWMKFKIGKEKKFDVMEFERHLEDNLFLLYHELKNKTYRHSGYEYFKITDPKKRDINKAMIRDRIVHQIVYDYLLIIYEPIFISDSYSSRINKGAHKAVARLKEFTRVIIKNHGQCFAFKCDIKKYFDSIDHEILLEIIKNKVRDTNILNLILAIISSFQVKLENNRYKGIPLGNITSQIFANIYLSELDNFVKKVLILKYYLRYNDDFIILDSNKKLLVNNLGKIKEFVSKKLLLKMPDDKIIFRNLRWGIDFCGFIILPNAILLRQKTKKRMIKNIAKLSLEYENEKISGSDFVQIINSYFGLLKHCDSYNLKTKIKNKYIYDKII